MVNVVSGGLAQEDEVEASHAILAAI